MNHHSRRGIFLLHRIISTFVSTTFLFTNFFVAPSYGMNASALADQKPSSIDSSSVSVPQEFGKIQETFSAKGGPASGGKGGEQTVILVQDAHAIPDAQRNIQKIIGHFQKEYGLNLIAVEGAASELDPQIFRSFPDKEVLKKIFDEYMEKGEVTGSTAAAIFNPNPAIYRGIEDWSLYEKGLGLYQKAMEKEPELLNQLRVKSEELRIGKEKTYSKELLEIDLALQSFRENHSDLMQVLKLLAKVKSPEKGSELALLLEEANSVGKDNSSLEIEVKKIAEEVKKSFQTQKGSDPLCFFSFQPKVPGISNLTNQRSGIRRMDVPECRGAIHCAHTRSGRDKSRPYIKNIKTPFPTNKESKADAGH